ncbi:MAG: transcription-repair coupling factor [Prevotella sp.]|jgi:transcription-repair coupling factor (superfamily II helicase)|nr:transcription-repair coupling factor [Prevotella sp.]
MKIEELRTLYASLPQLGGLAKLLKDGKTRHISLNGLVASAPALFFAAFAERCPYPILFILEDADTAGYFHNDLKALGIEPFLLPSSYRRAVKYGQRDAGSEILRTETMTALSAEKTEGKPLYIVTEPSALAERVVSKERLNDQTIRLETGQEVEVVALEKQLRALGFQEVDYVYEPGQFAVRGSILDVYSYSSEYPFRIDFFGDEIDTLRTFEVETQLSLQKRKQVEIVPELAQADHEQLTSFLHLLPEETLIVTKDLHYVADRIGKIFDEGFSKSAQTEQMEGKSEVEQEAIRQQMLAETKLIGRGKFLTDALGFRRIETATSPTHTAEAVITCETTPQPLFHKNFDLLLQTLRDDAAGGKRVFILADSQKQNDRLREIFASKVSESGGAPVAFTPVDRTLHEGFNDETLGVALYTDHQIFDRFHKYTLRSDKAKQGKMALTMKELREMEPGDFVVHVDFGIGKFAGLVRVPAGESYQEMIRLVYQHGDIADVSIHSLYKISKYRRAESGEAPRLSILGSGAWNKLKEKTKKRIKDIARDLIKLYAQRRHERGFAFSADNYMQHELEASFLYEDTPDQLKSTQQVKHDMESPRPMDRLVCGDVGFGKTEVAIRAAFKAACDNKQVAVLVPTTVLAFQHFKTFSKRLQGMPVRVDYLSRARTTKQTRQVTEDLAAGKIDILVGTHKLIGKSVKWKDLGLLIIDEEQKFGVATKEKLRQLKTNVDTLTLSATPIPRTLQFSLMGARDMSIMRTPPPNRYPIQTEIATFSSEVIADAINFEMSRGGQVFFVNDRIAGLAPIAEMIHKYVPDCRVGIGHGQMSPEELEKIVMGFMNYDYDVLLSTTIVENGIDISNANTIIINDAHRFGLSDLHQMRGRVGRSNRKAFCYLLAPPLANLTADARRRLEALETFSELGSGFSIAMQDLDIRGAGNLLGAEQSGFMEDLGYETYQKILTQAVTELKNDEFQDLYAEQIAQGEAISGDDFVDDCAVESDLEMYFPDNYVPGSSERMLLYRELDNIERDEELEAYRQRLIDRFGPVPRQGEELMLVVPLRRVGRRLGCEKIILRQGRMQMQFVSNTQSAFYQSAAFGRVINYIGYHPRRCNLKEKNGKRSMVVSQVASVKEAVEILKDIDEEKQ